MPLREYTYQNKGGRQIRIIREADMGRSANRVHYPTADGSFVGEAVEYIENCAAALNIEELADAVHVSRYHLGRRFKAQVGITPYQFFQEILIQISSVKSALHKTGQVILEGHLKHCVLDGIREGNGEETIKKLSSAIEQFSRIV
jgi:methylphosphotriester-DNA--protein-cysteine methyltransferase